MLLRVFLLERTVKARALLGGDAGGIQEGDELIDGDVFHGAYAACLARGASLPKRLETASACAALKAQQPGGRRGIPTWTTIEKFLKVQSLKNNLAL